MSTSPRLMKTRIQLRRSTAEKWESDNPILAQGEPGWDSANGVLKIGDGFRSWNDLPILSSFSTIVSEFDGGDAQGVLDIDGGSAMTSFWDQEFDGGEAA